MGSTTMPLSWRLTLSTSSAWPSIDRFRWMMPRPPCWARAMAIRDVVTVSMAALTTGMLRVMWRLRRVVTAAWAGAMSDAAGRIRTSSKVRASRIVSSSMAPPWLRSVLVALARDHGPGLLGPLAGRPRRLLVIHGRLLADGRRLVDDRLDQEEVAHAVLLDPVEHGLEHLEALFLVLDERVLLAVAPQADALLEMVHLEQVVLPLRVDDLQQDHPLELAHERSELPLLGLVRGVEPLDQGRPQLVVDDRVPVDPEGVDIDAELGQDGLAQAGPVPVLGRRVLVGVGVEHPVDEAVDVAAEVLALVLALEDLAALAVDRLPLLVHDVVVLEQVLADGEVLALDLFLG